MMEQEAAPAPAPAVSQELGQGVYQRNKANPFIPSGGAQMWSGNCLLLKNAGLRKRSGVTQLDQGVTDMYAVNPKSGSR